MPANSRDVVGPMPPMKELVISHTHPFSQSTAFPVPGRTHSWHAADSPMMIDGRGIGHDVTKQRRVAVEADHASRGERQHAGSENN